MHSAIPKHELKVFDSLENVHVVIDIGSRDDVDYLILKPDIQLHCFEPNPTFFEELKSQIGDRPNIFLNNYGLSSQKGLLPYSGESMMHKSGDYLLPVETLDWYVEEKGITRIDFLKVDAEGLDYEILKAAPKAVGMSRYIQYEHWDNDGLFRELLSSDFDIDYIGGRNSICTRKGELNPWIPKYPEEGGLVNKTDANKL